MKLMRACTHFNTYLLLILLLAVFAEDTTGSSGAAGETSSTPATTEPAATAETVTSAPEPTPDATAAPDTSSSEATPADTAQPPVSSDSTTSETTPTNTDPLTSANPEESQASSTGTNTINNPVPAPQEFQNPPPPGDATFNQVPQNCKRITDDNGIERVTCDTQCPNPPPESDLQKCRDNRGIPQFFADSRGCNIFECKYQESGNFGANSQCPSEEERSRVSEQCKTSGMRSIMRNDFNGCLIVDCVQEGEKNEMKCPPSEEDKRIADNCKQNGGRVVPGFDPRGCRISLCEYEGNIPGAMQNGPDSDRYVRNNECREIPKEAFEKCSIEGGELIVKKDNSGCPTFTECIMRGNERNLQYEEVSEVPDASILLSMAFKLENLKIEFDKLSKKTDAIAAYYDSTGKTADAERFRKASSMFIGAETRVDEIKSKMKTRVDSMTTNDISEIKHDIKYIREVVMKDILYVMLGGDESGEKIIDSQGSPGMENGKRGAIKPSKNSEGVVDCGTDGFCFNEQLRICEKAIFYPPSEAGGKTVMHITGLDNAKCILDAEVLDEMTGAPLAEMTCKFPDYVMGMKGPEELIPYCEGSMAEGFKKSSRAQNMGMMNNKNIPMPPKTVNDNYQEERPFGERPDGVAPDENIEYGAPVQPNQPMQPKEPIIIRQTGQEFPEEIAPIGYLLKQFAII